MIAKDAKVILTVKEQGALKSMARFGKKPKLKFMDYPFMKKTKKGLVMGSYDGKAWFKAKPKPITPAVPTTYHEVTVRTTINEEAVQFFISEDGKPSRIPSNKWKKMSEKERLEANLAINANGNSFTYQIID